MKLQDKVLRIANKYGIIIPDKLINGEIEVIDLAKGEEIVYRYEGKPAERSFCKEMLRLNKFYSKEEINVMSFQGKNRSFGHNGQSYSIWKYCGGPFCKHKWVAYTVKRNKQGQIQQTVKINNAEGVAGEIAKPSNNYKTHPNGPFKNL